MRHVNLIPINPVDGEPVSATDAANVHRFKKLDSLGVNATVRRRLGTDISAACGQLRRRGQMEEGTTCNEALRNNGHRQRSAAKTRTATARGAAGRYAVGWSATVWAARRAGGWPAPWRWIRCSSHEARHEALPRRPDADTAG